MYQDTAVSTAYFKVENPNEEVKFGQRYYAELTTVHNTLANSSVYEIDGRYMKIKRNCTRKYKENKGKMSKMSKKAERS